MTHDTLLGFNGNAVRGDELYHGLLSGGWLVIYRDATRHLKRWDSECRYEALDKYFAPRIAVLVL